MPVRTLTSSPVPFSSPYKGEEKGRRGSPAVCLIVVLALLVSGCEQIPAEGGGAPVPTITSVQPSVDWFTLYFTNPHSANAELFRGGPDEEVAAAIGKAQSTVDAALYDLDLDSISQALLAANQRGVAVRVVTESDNLDEPQIQDLKDAGIPVLGDRREGLMHNKFIIIDRQEIWTGSMNFTRNDVYRNDNNLIRIRSAQLAEDYRTEFDEMFVSDLFGPDTSAHTPYPIVTIKNTQVEVFFSPDDHTGTRLKELLQDAQESIYFLAYSFTSDTLAKVMMERATAGVEVGGVFEESQKESNIGGEYGRLRKAGLDVHLDGNPRNMHHKVIIIDGKIVVTGSYNFTSSADRNNDENTLIIHNAGIAALYKAEYDRIYQEAKP